MFSSLRQALTFKSTRTSSQHFYEEYFSTNHPDTTLPLDSPQSSQFSDFESVFSRENYKGHQRRASSFESMNSSVQELPKEELMGGRQKGNAKGTGFPEPLSMDRNTTLPHPDADTSPNATIEAPDDDLVRTHSRSSFLHRRHHSNHKTHINNSNSNSKLELSHMYSIQYADGTTETKDFSQAERPSVVGVAREGVVSRESESSVDSIENAKFDNGEEKTRGFFKKLVH